MWAHRMLEGRPAERNGTLQFGYAGQEVRLAEFVGGFHRLAALSCCSAIRSRDTKHKVAPDANLTEWE